jgi:hypothetical protein
LTCPVKVGVCVFTPEADDFLSDSVLLIQVLIVSEMISGVSPLTEFYLESSCGMKIRMKIGIIPTDLMLVASALMVTKVVSNKSLDISSIASGSKILVAMFSHFVRA